MQVFPSEVELQLGELGGFSSRDGTQHALRMFARTRRHTSHTVPHFDVARAVMK
jgi:hypothetical protein